MTETATEGLGLDFPDERKRGGGNTAELSKLTQSNTHFFWRTCAHHVHIKANQSMSPSCQNMPKHARTCHANATKHAEKPRRFPVRDRPIKPANLQNDMHSKSSDPVKSKRTHWSDTFQVPMIFQSMIFSAMYLCKHLGQSLIMDQN